MQRTEGWAAGLYLAALSLRDRADPERFVERFRYTDGEGRPTREANPNGSARNIAGIVNRQRNVLGLMPHPERACESVVGGAEGLKVFRSILHSFAGETLKI